MALSWSSAERSGIEMKFVDFMINPAGGCPVFMSLSLKWNLNFNFAECIETC